MSDYNGSKTPFSGVSSRYIRGTKAFSLIEMSAVLASVAVVAALSVGGVGLVERAKLNQVVDDIRLFTEASESFKDTYGQLPGDIADTDALSGGGIVAGNGNGAIDSASEALNFWRHLSLAGLISGRYDGQTNLPAIGLPQGEINGSGYRVLAFSSGSSNNSQDLVFEFAGFSAQTEGLPILTTEDARSIDERLDDGLPNSGLVRGLEGDGVSSGDCVTGQGEYNLNNENTSCILRFIVSSSSVAESSNNACGEVGLTRESGVDFCPSGYEGKIMQRCSSNQGSIEWENSSNNCKALRCLGDAHVGDSRVLSCINGQIGNGIIQTCSSEGIWVNVSSDCTTPTNTSQALCSEVGSTRKPLACGFGQQGHVFQFCNDSQQWQTSEDSCTTITCGADVLYKTRVNSTDTACQNSVYEGVVTEMCSLDGTWRVVANRCSAQYDDNISCNQGNTRDIGCPIGETGQHQQGCVNGIWTTESDTCQAITCGEARFGESRAARNLRCPDEVEGTIIQICGDANDDGVGDWQVVSSNCTTNICSGAGDNRGFANWPNATAGSSNVSAASCIQGYETPTPGGSLPVRDCDSNGRWNNLVGSCVRKQCPARNIGSEGEGNALWAETDSLTSGVQGTCINGYQGSPLRNCDANGNWGDVAFPCVQSDPNVDSRHLVLWFDMSDASTVFNNAGCTSLASSSQQAYCIGDKSGYGRNAVQAVSSSTGTYHASNSLLNYKGSLLISSGDHYDFPRFTPGNEATVFVVLQSLLTPGGSDILSDSTPGSNSYVRFLNQNTVHTNPPSAVYSLSSGLSPYDDALLLSVVYNADARQQVVHINGEAVGLDNTPFAYSNMYFKTVGDDVASFGGYYAEIRVYNKALSASDRLAVESELASKWAINVPRQGLPIDYERVNLWLDATDVYNNGLPVQGEISDWVDKSDKGHTVTNNDIKPTVIANALNGLRVVDFDRNEILSRPNVDHADISLVNQVSVLAVQRSFDNLGVSGFVSWRGNPVINTYWLSVESSMNGDVFFTHGNNCCHSVFNGNPPYSTIERNLGSNAIGNSWHVVEAVRENLEGKVWISGIPVLEGELGTTVTDHLGLLRVGANALGQGIDGQIAEIVLVEDAISDGERKAMEAYFANKWGVVSADIPVTDGLSLWLDASASGVAFSDSSCTTIAVAGEDVACWRDLSGTFTNALGVSGSLPKFVSSNPKMNYRSSIQFEDNSDRLATTLPNSQGSASVFVVADYNTGTNDNYIITNRISDNLYIAVNSSDNFRLSITGSMLSLDGRTTQTRIISANLGSTSNICIDGLCATASNIGTPSYSGFNIGAGQNIANTGFNGDIGEIIVYNQTLSDSQRREMECHLARKWGVEVPNCSLF